MKHGLGGFAKGILNREFSHEQFTRTLTGQKKHIPSAANPRGKATDMHHRIAQIAAKVENDPIYRKKLAAANLHKLGTTRLNTF
jgi:hypothetical protein